MSKLTALAVNNAKPGRHADGEALEQLMDMPAPDLAALRWKLEQLHEGDGGMPAWTAEYIAQTYADVARLMPKEA